MPGDLPDEFDRILGDLLGEYFENGDVKEVRGAPWTRCTEPGRVAARTLTLPGGAQFIALIKEHNILTDSARVVSDIIVIALGRRNAERELVSVLISEMYGANALSSDVCREAFTRLLRDADELKLDVPEASKLLGNFIARAVADDLLSPKVVEDWATELQLGLAGIQALESARALLRMNHGLVRLDSVWGVGGGRRPVKVLRKRIILLLREFLSSNDAAEAERCIRELDVPHFHHEIVYEAAVLMFESNDPQVVERLTSLLGHLCRAAVITTNQLQTGLTRLHDDLAELSLDHPSAPALLERLSNYVTAQGYLTLAAVANARQRGRKRYVSEGDGGMIKP